MNKFKLKKILIFSTAFFLTFSFGFSENEVKKEESKKEFSKDIAFVKGPKSAPPTEEQLNEIKRKMGHFHLVVEIKKEEDEENFLTKFLNYIMSFF